MQSFVDQQGVPLLTFARIGSNANDTWTVGQSRYVQLGTTAPATRWGVPMCLRRGSCGPSPPSRHGSPAPAWPRRKRRWPVN